MAKAKAGSSSNSKSKLAKTESEQHRITEKYITIRLAILCFFGTLSIGIIAWATVKITDKPPWLVFALSLVALIAAPSFVIRKLLIRLRVKNSPRQVDRILRYVSNHPDEPADSAEKPTEGDENGS